MIYTSDTFTEETVRKAKAHFFHCTANEWGKRRVDFGRMIEREQPTLVLERGLENQASERYEEDCG